MRRAVPETVETSGQDSFVDVVTNLVGIMIVLVIIVGVKVKHVWVDPASAKGRPPVPRMPNPPLDSRRCNRPPRPLKETSAAPASKSMHMDQELAARGIEREELATLVAAGKRELADRRGHLDAGTRADFDLKQQLAALWRSSTKARPSWIESRTIIRRRSNCGTS